MSTKKLTLQNETFQRASDQVQVLASKQINKKITPSQIRLDNSKYIILENVTGDADSYIVRDGSDNLLIANLLSTGGEIWLVHTMSSGNQRYLLLKEYGATDTQAIQAPYDLTLVTENGDINLMPAAHVGIGTITPSAKADIVGDADEVQLSVQANGTQTNPVFQIKNSSGGATTQMGAGGRVFFADVGLALSSTYPFQTYYTATHLSGTTWGELHRMNWDGVAPSTGAYIGEEHRTSNLAATSLAAMISNLYSTYISNASGSVGLADTFRVSSYVAGSATTLTELRLRDYTGGGSVTTHNALEIESLTAATTNNAIKTGSGFVAFGDQVKITGSADRVQFIAKANATQTNNIAEIQNSGGTALAYFNNIGELYTDRIGVGAPPSSTNKIFVYDSLSLNSGNQSSFRVYSRNTPTANSSTVLQGLRIDSVADGTFDHNTMISFLNRPEHAGSGTVGLLVGEQMQLVVTGGGVLGQGYGFDIPTPAVVSGSITTFIGLNIGNQNAATNNYAIHTGAGFVRLGDQLSIIGSADRVQLIARANATQTTNIAEIQDSAGTALAYFNNVGKLTVPTYERHTQIPASLAGNPSAQPTQVAFGTVAGLQFGTTGTKYAYFQWEIPDDWDGTNIFVEVDWMPDSGAMTAPAAVKWDISYVSKAEGEVLVTTATAVTVTHNTTTAQYQSIHSRMTLTYNNATNPLAKQDHIYFQISRDTAVANDFGGTVTVPAFEIIYMSTAIPTGN